MRKILVPIDGSDCALRALRHAISIAKETSGLQIELLHVLDPMSTSAYASLSHDEIKRIQADDAEQMLQPAAKLLDQAGLPYVKQVRAGSPANEIADQVYESQCEGVIMGTRGMSAIGNLMIGSIATNVVHLVEVPVTLIK